jgi:hypothetical protein
MKCDVNVTNWTRTCGRPSIFHVLYETHCFIPRVVNFTNVLSMFYYFCFNFCPNYLYRKYTENEIQYFLKIGTRGSVVGWGTVLQAGSSRDRVLMGWIFFSNLPNPFETYEESENRTTRLLENGRYMEVMISFKPRPFYLRHRYCII